MKNPNVVNVERINDIALAKLRANYGNPAKGYLEKEADEMRAKILNTGNTEEYYEIKGTKFYFSTSGNDQNDGLTPDTPKASQEALEALPLKSGDAVLFKRGDIFRYTSTYRTVDGITYGSYGEGLKPAFYGSPEEYAENDTWREVKPNIWEIDFPYVYAGGCVLDYSMIIGVQKFQGIEALGENGDYTNDFENQKFYLYCDLGKPNEVYHSIEIMNACTIFQMKGSRDIVIDNICFKYSSGFAISSPDPKGNIKITNCEFGFLGGKWYGKEKGRLRYGNALEVWGGLPNLCVDGFYVQNNWFYQTYDSALTWQGNQSGTIYKDFTYTENLFEYNNCDIEFFDRDKSVLDNFVISGNIMRFTSMGWGTRTFDGGIRGIEGCIRATTGAPERKMIITAAYFTDNKLDCPARQIINWNTHPEQKEKIHASGTVLYVDSSYRTLEPCLQGLMDDLETEAVNRRFAKNEQELREMFPKFEKNAEIHWDEEK